MPLSFPEALKASMKELQNIRQDAESKGIDYRDAFSQVTEGGDHASVDQLAGAIRLWSQGTPGWLGELIKVEAKTAPPSLMLLPVALSWLVLLIVELLYWLARRAGGDPGPMWSYWSSSTYLPPWLLPLLVVLGLVLVAALMLRDRGREKESDRLASRISQVGQRLTLASGDATDLSPLAGDLALIRGVVTEAYDQIRRGMRMPADGERPTRSLLRALDDAEADLARIAESAVASTHAFRAAVAEWSAAGVALTDSAGTFSRSAGQVSEAVSQLQTLAHRLDSRSEALGSDAAHASEILRGGGVIASDLAKMTRLVGEVTTGQERLSEQLLDTSKSTVETLRKTHEVLAYIDGMVAARGVDR